MKLQQSLSVVHGPSPSAVQVLPSDSVTTHDAARVTTEPITASANHREIIVASMARAAFRSARKIQVPLASSASTVRKEQG
jgi:hypothetical protein